MITKQEADVLSHTSQNGRYVTGDPFVLQMASDGLLFDYGPQALAGGDHYLTTTLSGRQALREWREAQPKPKVKRRRVSRQFEAWENYKDACGGISFPDFLKTVWNVGGAR